MLMRNIAAEINEIRVRLEAIEIELAAGVLPIPRSVKSHAEVRSRDRSLLAPRSRCSWR